MKRILNSAISKIANNLSKERTKIVVKGIDFDEAGDELVSEKLKEFDKKPSTIIQKAVLQKLQEFNQSQER